jgi:hypothetical protein
MQAAHMSSKPLKIHLGPGWNRFSTRRGDLELLGTVQDGMTIGALGRLADGRYVQVNGDIERALNSSRVKMTLAKAESVGRPRPTHRAAVRQAAAQLSAPVVVVKRRRIPLAVPANLEPSLDTTE